MKERYKKTIAETGLKYRQAVLQSHADGENRTYSFTFSSAEPIKDTAIWDGESIVIGTEILEHTRQAVDLGFIGSGRAPFLKDHDWGKQVGVIEGVELDEETQTLRVKNIKFSQSDEAQELKRDIDDGIRQNVSVGYFIEEMKEKERGVYHVTKWKPYEVSSVAIPADEKVGFGRAKSDEKRYKTTIYKLKSEEMENIKVVEKENDLERISQVAQLNSRNFEDGVQIASKAIAEKRSFKEFWAEYEPALKKESERQATVKLNLTPKEKRNFSLLNLIRSEVNQTKDAQFEREVCEEYKKKRGITTQRDGLIIPYEALPLSHGKRAAIMSSGTGSDLVEENMSSDVIDYLRETSITMRAGATVMDGLVGKYDMASLDTPATAHIVSEVDESGAEVALSSMDFGSLTFTPNTLMVSQGITRRQLNQTSIDVEAIVRRELFVAIADAIDRSAIRGTTPAGIMNTGGVNTVNLATANTPTWGEIVDMETRVAEDNALRGKLAYVTPPSVVGTLKQTLKSAGVSGYILEDGRMNGYPVFASAYATETASPFQKDVIFGNFDDLMLGMWGGFELTVNPYTHDRRGIIMLTLFKEFDVQVRHAVSFCVARDSS